MTIEGALYSLVTSDGTVSGLIGTRMYPTKLPQDPTFPAVTYTRVSGTRGATHSGPAGYATPLFQIDSWSNDFTQCKTLANAIRAVLHGYVGTSASVFVGHILIVNESDLLEDTTHTYRTMQEYRLFHDE